MRKLCLLLAMLLLVACFASCDGNGNETPTGTNAPEVTTAKPDNNEAPTEKETETDAPETPQDKWTERY